MAIPSYTTDLTDWILDNDTAAWTELTGKTQGGGAPDEADTESSLQGTNTVSQTTTTANAEATMIRILGTPVTLPTGHVFLVWHGHGVATALDTYAAGGLRIYVAGNSAANYKGWSVGGIDTPPFPYGKWINNAVDPTVPDDGANYINGTPPTGGSNIQGVGVGCIVTQTIQRGQPHVCDIIRYGRAEARFSGGDSVDGFCTFTGFAAVNDTSLNRWGLIQSTTGGYQWKGLIVLGSGSVVQFVDSNKSIFIQDCRKVSSTFNKIEIRQAGSIVSWSNISISNSSPSTTASLGDFEVIDNATVTLDGCTFTDMGTWILQSNTTITDTTFRRCQQITLNSADFSDSTVARSTAAIAMLVGSDVSTLSNTTFISAGTGHAIEITGGTTHTLNNLTFTNYPVGTAGTNITTTNTENEAVYVSVTSGTVTLNITGGNIPSVRSAGAQINVVSSALVTLTGLQSDSEVRAYVGTDPATSTEIAGVESSGTSFTFSQSFSGQQGYIIVLAFGYVPLYQSITYGSTDVDIPVQQTVDRVYSNPVGA